MLHGLAVGYESTVVEEDWLERFERGNHFYERGYWTTTEAEENEVAAQLIVCTLGGWAAELSQVDGAGSIPVEHPLDGHDHALVARLARVLDPVKPDALIQRAWFVTRELLLLRAVQKANHVLAMALAANPTLDAFDPEAYEILRRCLTNSPIAEWSASQQRLEFIRYGFSWPWVADFG